MSATDDSSRISRYLLEDVTPAEQEEIERRYFADPEYLALVEALEGDLIDAYVRRDLSRADHERFERYFLRTRTRRERVKMAEALLAHLPKRRSFLPVILAIAATLVVLVGLGAWLATREAAAPVPPVASVPVAQPTAPTRSPVIVVITLMPGLTRAAATLPKVVLPRDADAVRVNALIDVEGEWRDLNASLRSSDWIANHLTINDDRMVTVTIPAAKLTPGEQVLIISAGAEVLGDYAFVVESAGSSR
jgi:hypothetical protein